MENNHRKKNLYRFVPHDLDHPTWHPDYSVQISLVSECMPSISDELNSVPTVGHSIYVVEVLWDWQPSIMESNCAH